MIHDFFDVVVEVQSIHGVGDMRFGTGHTEEGSQLRRISS